MHLHVRTCPPLFHISQTAWRIVFRFGVWLRTHQIRALQKSEMGCICTCARAHPFPNLANGLEDCVEMWCVAKNPFDESYASHLRCGTNLHVRRCTLRTPFARSCLRGRPFIADHGALMVLFCCLRDCLLINNKSTACSWKNMTPVAGKTRDTVTGIGRCYMD